ncbi:MAG TPA: hypothetical protein VJ926_02780 [Patescibacteria group bacterium]|nr:hypothetical protein [Patescibacteria group bacterium]
MKEKIKFEEKASHEKLVWLMFYLAIAIAGITLWSLLNIVIAVIAVTIFLIIFFAAFSRSGKQGYVDVVSYFNRYYRQTNKGFYLIMGLLGIYKTIRYCVVYHTIQLLKYDPKNEQLFLVDFKNGHAYADLMLALIVVDPEKAFSNVDNVYKQIIIKFRKIFRNYAEDQKIDDLKSEKKNLNLDNLIGKKDENGNVIEGSYKEHPVFMTIRDDWGVEIQEIILQDLIFSEEDQSAKSKVYHAELSSEAKLIDAAAAKAVRIKESEGESKAMRNLARAVKDAESDKGEGYRIFVEKLKSQGVPESKVVQLISDLKKFEQMPDNTYLFEGSGQTVSDDVIKAAVVAANVNEKK